MAIPVPNIASVPISRTPSRSRSSRSRRNSNSFRAPGGGVIKSLHTQAHDTIAITNTDATLSSPDKNVLYTTGNTNRTLTLPLAADYEGVVVSVNKIDSGTGYLIIDGNGAELIDGATSWSLANNLSSVQMVSIGTGWHKVAITGLNFPSLVTTLTVVNSNHTITLPTQLLYVSTGASNRTITLPTAKQYTAAYLHVKKADSGAGQVIVQRAGTDTIDGATSRTITTQFGVLTLMGEQGGWYVLGFQDPP